MPKTVFIRSDQTAASGQILKDNGVHAIHATNGTYAHAKDTLFPTTLAGFQYVSERVGGHDDAFFVAINSNVSLRGLAQQKGASEAELAALEDEQTRADKIIAALQAQHPTRKIVIAFFDQATPKELYAGLKSSGINLLSLHKWGYGTGDTPRIEGAEFFERTLAFPLPQQAKAYAHDITPKGRQRGTVQVRDLRKEHGSHGSPYLSEDGAILFPLAPLAENEVRQQALCSPRL